jgi:two-component system, OmpR family, phosphate regulon sensor histidine kinase PhoR
MSLTGVIVALSVGVILPVILSTSVGIVTLALGTSSGSIVIGVLIICFAAAAFGVAIAVTVLLGRRNRLARLQADLLANVTHDLRTPLAAIRMYAQTLHLGRVADNPKATADCLDAILRETEWLESMIERVLAWRAAAKDRDVLELQVATLEEALNEAVTRFRHMTANEAGPECDIRTQVKIPHDKQAIVSIVLNLLINAYKYTGPDKAIRLAAADLDGWVEIAVEDNGIGIPPREVGRIFDPFYRVDATLKGKSSGAGLGLAIVRHHVLSHRGQVYVDSAPGKGSRFSVRFPVARKGVAP